MGETEVLSKIYGIASKLSTDAIIKANNMKVHPEMSRGYVIGATQMNAEFLTEILKIVKEAFQGYDASLADQEKNND